MSVPTAALGKALSPGAVRWLGDDAPARSLACPVCGNAGPHRALLAVASMADPAVELTLLRCAGCGSGHYDPPGAADFSGLGAVDDIFWRHYVEVGGGVFETIWPILSESTPGRRTLLDVGCGFGFAVDFWSRMRGEAVGVELADYGRRGAAMLGITVYDELLQDCAALAGRRFDVVHASEVIEHVPDPVAFMALLARYLTDAGVLVLTTPSMDWITRSNHSLALHAALAPGFHGFLLSAGAFGAIARRAGFAHVEVRRFAERQVLWASQAPLSVEPSTPAMQRDYEQYVDGRLASLDHASPVWQGYAFRAIKERANAGRVAEMVPLAAQLVDAVAAAFGDALRDPDELVARVQQCADLTAIGRAMPYFMPGLHYHLAKLALAVDRDAPRAERHFRASVEATVAAARTGPVMFMDALASLWHARVALGELAFVRGDTAAGVAEFVRIARGAGRADEANGYAIVPRALAEGALPTVVGLLVDHGQHDAAREVFEAYASYVRAEYGEGLLDADGVDRALASGSPVPLDPLFVPAMRALMAWRDAPAGARAPTERAVAVARKWSSHAEAGNRMRLHEQALRRRLAAPPATGWSANYTLKG